MKKKILSASVLFFIFGVNLVLAADPNVVIMGESVDTNSLNGFAQLAVIFAKWILGISGAAALLMFVYGGVMFLISGGSSDKVNKGKSILSGSAIGLLIVFLSYTIIGLVLKTMGITNANWASTGWFGGH